MRRLAMLSGLALLGACTPPAAEDDGETGSSTETGDVIDEEACIDPGTELLPNVNPALLPTPEDALGFTCTNGWGTDAPRLEPEWTVQIGELTSDVDEDSDILAIAAHPDGGVIVAGLGQFSHYGSDGEAVWMSSIAGSSSAVYDLEVEDAGTILLAHQDNAAGETALTRHGGDGQLIGTIDIPWNSEYPRIWAVESFGTDIVVGADDRDSQGNLETTLIRLDGEGNVALRKSTDMTSSPGLVVNDNGVLAFGTSPPYIVALADGEVFGTVVPTSANVPFVSSIASVGDDFFVAGWDIGPTADLIVGRYTRTGAQQWLQTYDRATLGDAARAIAAGPDGTIAVIGTTRLLNNTDIYWFASQPVVFGVDTDGNALWTDRIAAHAEALAVAVGNDGDVYVVGVADADIQGSDVPLVVWLRRYVP